MSNEPTTEFTEEDKKRINEKGFFEAMRENIEENSIRTSVEIAGLIEETEGDDFEDIMKTHKWIELETHNKIVARLKAELTDSIPKEKIREIKIEIMKNGIYEIEIDGEMKAGVVDVKRLFESLNKLLGDEPKGDK